MGKFPVVFISLKDIAGLTYEEAQQGLIEVIAEEVSRLEMLHNSTLLSSIERKQLNNMMEGIFTKQSLKSSLKKLTSLFRKHYGKKSCS